MKHLETRQTQFGRAACCEGPPQTSHCTHPADIAHHGPRGCAATPDPEPVCRGMCFLVGAQEQGHFSLRLVIKGSLEGTSVLRQLIESLLSETNYKRRNKPARKNARACGRGRESRKKRGTVHDSASPEMRKSQKAWPCA